MKIAVIGTGYVGLVTGTCLAEVGNHVICVDIDKAKVSAMQKGKIPIYEPSLEEMFHRNINEKRLTFTTELKEGVKNAEIIFLALPTPSTEDGSADLSYILSVSDQLGILLKNYTIVIDKSTVPVGTAEKVRIQIDKKTKQKFDVVSNPEFLREGFAVEDFMKPDRIIIGTSSIKARRILQQLYAPFVRQGNPILFMDEKSAEMTKYAANVFLATKISFINEIANLCEKLGANVDHVRLGIGADERIGKRFLFPGIGYGGSCFPKDIRALQKMAVDHNYPFKILEAVIKVNALQKQILIKKLKTYYNNDIKNKVFALWGLAFKPNTDDIREAPALLIIDELLAAGAKIRAYDPEAANNVRKHYGLNKNLIISHDQYEILENADALLIATEWSMFRSPDFEAMIQKLKKPVVFDGRNLYKPEEMSQRGFHYESIGRTY